MTDSEKAKCIPCGEANPDDVLSSQKVSERLSELKEWKSIKDGKAITKEFTFKDFVKAMAFVDQVADVAEGAGHHPDIFISYNHVTLELSTHSVGGVTENDFIVAGQVDGLWLV